MKVVIKNVPPYDGEYPLDLSHMTNREVSTIKRISGYTPLEWEAAGDRGDTDIIIAFAVVALTRTGRFLPKVQEDVLWDSDMGKIDISTDDEEADAESPPPVSEPSDTSEPSGSAGNAGSDTPQESAPRSIGSPPSPTSATSDQPTLEISRLTS